MLDPYAEGEGRPELVPQRAAATEGGPYNDKKVDWNEEMKRQTA